MSISDIFVYEDIKQAEKIYKEGVIEILEAHLSAKNKSQLSKDHNLPRTTFYHAFKNKNPTLQTLAKLIHATS